MKKQNTLLFLLLICGSISPIFGQENKVQINQDPKIEELIKIKKSIDSEQFSDQYYAIQLYYGNYTAAIKIVEDFNLNFEGIETSLIFETPNYKVRVGRFKNLNKANLLLEEIKKTYPGAFLLEPNNL
ncbi:SPOR domain-containing protein [Flavobacteriaceae bacterium]|uniref:SPOR domain-containing protein n=1 Tax=Candidatus Arcticimaribacter forsetii TaxID=2820661 RepID=UPI0020775BF3|nr:SPOR domain-containing protein [Candidatus Arcticimaribacter forsetii]MDB2457229.1 SPOR domain-containing protein [Flavobacteriaceae bacterium]MDB4620575.1 SPOR domain-containing protein [Flavobacteriaceae bacterium]MDB4643733.1 SPOR domain-containing protein [Flavobacteriaceae bacterium]MDB4674320.1 SPOR domain-containing protein [Flavobacteriaceae bacterium]